MTTTASRIRGSVAKILNPREIVINRGAEDGVETGMWFAVLDPGEDEVTDPETGEALGVIHRPKIKVIVNRVEPRLALARAFGVNASGAYWAALARALGEPSPDDGEDGDRPVRTGDPVEQVLEREAAS